MSLASTLLSNVHASCVLKVETKTLQATANGQIIENVDVRAPPGAAGISVSGFKDVTIRNVNVTFGMTTAAQIRILCDICIRKNHSNEFPDYIFVGPTSRGIEFNDADNLSIINASLELHGAANASGPLPTAAAVAITGSDSAWVRINRVRARGSSSGVYLIQSANAQLSFIEGHNMRGPFPRGQCVQVRCIVIN